MSRGAGAPGGPTSGARRAVEVRVGTPEVVGDRVRHAAEVRVPDQRTRALWYEVDAAHADLVTPTATPAPSRP